MRKVFITGVVVLSMVGSLSACNSDKTEVSSTEATEEVVASTTEADEFTGERDGSFFILGSKVDKGTYTAYLEMNGKGSGVEVLENTEFASTEDVASAENDNNSSKKTSEGKSSENNSNGGSINNNTSTKPSSTNSKANSSDSSTPSSTPTSTPASSQSTACTHNWVEVMATVHHEAQYKNINHPAVYYNYYCRECERWYLPSEHDTCSDGFTGQKLCTEAWTEKVLVKDAYDEQVGTGVYQCSKCGAKK